MLLALAYFALLSYLHVGLPPPRLRRRYSCTSSEGINTGLEASQDDRPERTAKEIVAS